MWLQGVNCLCTWHCFYPIFSTLYLSLRKQTNKKTRFFNPQHNKIACTSSCNKISWVLCLLVQVSVCFQLLSNTLSHQMPIITVTWWNVSVHKRPGTQFSHIYLWTHQSTFQDGCLSLNPLQFTLKFRVSSFFHAHERTLQSYVIFKSNKSLSHAFLTFSCSPFC